MAELSKEQMDEAIARAQREVADEVSEHQAEDKDLENVAGGATSGDFATDREVLWEVGVIYKT